MSARHNVSVATRSGAEAPVSRWRRGISSGGGPADTEGERTPPVVEWPRPRRRRLPAGGLRSKRAQAVGLLLSPGRTQVNGAIEWQSLPRASSFSKLQQALGTRFVSAVEPVRASFRVLVECTG